MNRLLYFVWITILLCGCNDKENQVSPSVVTRSLELVNASTAKVTGQIEETGSLPVTDYGFVYSARYAPTIESDAIISLGSDVTISNVSSEIPASGDQLLARMYLTNSKGTIYGKVLEIKIPSPGIGYIFPTSGHIGEQVKIYGQNFSTNIADHYVQFGNIPAKVLDAKHDVLTVEIPEGFYNRVTVSVSTGAKQLSLYNAFTLSPSITDYNPKNGTFRTEVTVTGNGFMNYYYNDNKIRFGNADCFYNYVNSTTIKITVPNDVNTDTAMIRLGFDSFTEIGEFTMDPPSIESFTPEYAIATCPTPITIIGKHINPGSYNILKIGGIELKHLSPNYQNEISVLIPNSLKPGSYEVELFNGIEWVKATAKLNIVTPEVSSVSPASGYPGSKVTLTGTFFDLVSDSYGSVYFGDWEVYLNGLDIDYVTASPQQQITIEVPNIATGAYDMEILLYNSKLKIPIAQKFTVKPSSITGFTPTSGVPGSEIIIVGENLMNSEVLFGTTKARILSSKPTEIKVQVPTVLLSGSMKISIVTRGETVISTSDFIVK